MAWELVAPLVALRSELNGIAPRRDKASDGSIGDQAHAGSQSSHNPDRSGNPEWRDGDSKDEVRAVDLDSDLNVPGLTMERVVQHLVKLCRSGVIWWLEYIIYRGRIWTRSGGWATQRYSGDNPHNEHAHVNSRFTNQADGFTGATYRLKELVDDMPSADEVVKGLLAAPLDRPAWSPVAGAKPTMRLDAVLETTLNLIGGEQRATLAEIKTAQAEIKAAQARILAAVDGVDEAVMERIGADRPPAETAALLKAALGSRAEAVFRAGLGQG